MLASALEAPISEYWEALGRFIHEFAKVESLLITLLRDLSKTSDETAGAIFSGLRVDGAKDTINRILDATGQTDIKSRLQSPFAQLGVIAGVRNKIVHWGATYDGGEQLLVTNARLYPTAARLTEIRVGAKDIKLMTGDLFKIALYLILEIRDYGDGDPDWAREELKRPWLYTLPAPPPRRKETRRQAPKRVRPQRSSQE
jgi:hypothetical protein